MLEVVVSSAFHRDIRRMIKRGKNIVKLKYVISMLENQAALSLKYCDHHLSGNYQDIRNVISSPTGY